MGRPIQADSVQQRARRAGLNPSTVYNRISTGWSVEKALAVPAASHDGPIAEAARAIGLNPDTVRKRIRRYGMTLEQALHPFRRRC